jgi:hypothetical protein
MAEDADHDLPINTPHGFNSWSTSCRSFEEVERERERLANENIRSIIQFVLDLFDSIFARQKRMKDPVVRYSLLCDKLAMIPELLIATLKSKYMGEGVNIELMKRLVESGDKFSNEITSMMEWIAQPHYSPYTEFGESIMKEAKEEFTSTAATMLPRTESATIQQVFKESEDLTPLKKLIEETRDMIHQFTKKDEIVNTTRDERYNIQQISIPKRLLEERSELIQLLDGRKIDDAAKTV